MKAFIGRLMWGLLSDFAWLVSLESSSLLVSISPKSHFVKICDNQNKKPVYNTAMLPLT